MTGSRWRFLVVLALAGGAFAAAAPAQDAGSSLFPVDPIELLRQLLGPDAGFTASALVSGDSTNEAESFSMDVSYAMRRDLVRTETDLSRLRGLRACDIAQGHLQDSGIDDIITIRIPTLKRLYMIYPHARSYIETPLTWRERLKELVEIRRSEIGKETLEGHPCIKQRVLATNQLGEKTEVLVWEATDLNRFPVQLRFEMPEATFNILFRDVKLTAPDISVFQPPAEFDRYESPVELWRAVRGHR